MASKLFFDEHIKFVSENVKGRSNRELTIMLNEHFGTSFTEKQVFNMKRRYGFKSGNDGRFKKGHVPANKGKKMSPEQYEICKRTFFKKGEHRNGFKHPVGAEVVKTDSYVYVKVDDKPNARFRDNWKMKHHLIWEEHYGEVPKDCVLMFLDGNKYNFDINNLICITKKERAVLNKNYKIYQDADMTKTSILLTKLKMKANEKKHD